jgi:ankyrin repeat protein
MDETINQSLHNLAQNINVNNESIGTPLIVAINTSYEMVQFLLQHGADPYSSSSVYCETAYYYAVRKGRKDIVNLIENMEVIKEPGFN